MMFWKISMIICELDCSKEQKTKKSLKMKKKWKNIELWFDFENNFKSYNTKRFDDKYQIKKTVICRRNIS